MKLVLLLVLMLNAVRLQQFTDNLETLPPSVSEANVPWSMFRRIIGAAAVSQIAWWGTIVIGFVTSTSR